MITRVRTRDPLLHRVELKTEDKFDDDPVAKDIKDLRNWALKTKASRKDISDLLTILKRGMLPKIPSMVQAFIHTANTADNIKPMTGVTRKEILKKGEFIYIGLERHLKYIEKRTIPELFLNMNNIELQVNILCRFLNLVIAIYCQFQQKFMEYQN